MEILQTIWTALTTENVVLSNIFTYLLGFFEALVTMLIFTTILNINASKTHKILYVIIFTVISILNSVYIPNPINTFINVLICPILVITIFKSKVFIAILAELIPYIIFVLVASVIHIFFINIFNVTTNMISVIPIYKICYLLCLYLSVYIVYLILKHFKFNINMLANIRSKTNYTLLINFIIGILAVGVQSYVSFIYSDKLPLGVIILSVSTLLFYFVISFYSLIRTNKLEVTERDLEQSKQYINTLTILHDSIRCFKHDFNNIVTTIGRLCSNK